MMREALRLLIDAAAGERDRHTTMLGRARQAQAQAEATLQRLHAFRVECLARSAAGRRGASDGGALHTYQTFVGRLDEAIRLQQDEAALRRQRADEQLQLLQAAQQRLLALQALQAREGRKLLAREQRREQHANDEFAARAHLRAAQENAA